MARTGDAGAGRGAGGAEAGTEQEGGTSVRSPVTVL